MSEGIDSGPSLFSGAQSGVIAPAIVYIDNVTSDKAGYSQCH